MADIVDTPDDHIDQFFMRRCLELADRAAGKTSPNPLVGSVVINQGEVVGEGYHPSAGNPHAEVFALQAAGDRARGATLYVNLEPCNHTGRTPPCTEAILAAGIRRVVVGMIDPDPRVSGSGIQRLQDAGLEVTVGIETLACEQLNEAFVHSVRYHRPFGILKYAMTLDGKIATTTGHSAWITSPASRSWVHRLRGRCDAVIVGGQTVRQDNPQLTTHGQSDRNPRRIVMSRYLDLPPEAQLWQVETAQTTIFCGPERDLDRQRQLAQRGVQVIVLPTLDPLTVLTALHAQGMRSVLWECGGQLTAQAIRQNCIQKVYAFIAPKVIGGTTAPGPIADLGLSQMTAALSLNRLTFQQLEPDFLVAGYLPEMSAPNHHLEAGEPNP